MGLKNAWGTLSLGNQLDMTEEFVYLYNISAWASGYAIHQGDFDRMNGDRLPNSVKFLSNDYAGFSFGGMYSFGNTAGDFHNKSAWSVGARYEHSAFNMGAAYTQLNNPLRHLCVRPVRDDRHAHVPRQADRVRRSGDRRGDGPV